MEQTTPNIVDHDLLIELRTEMRAVRVDIKDIKDGTTSRILKLEADKEDKVEVAKIAKNIKDNLEVFVTKEQFGLVQKIVFGEVALILLAVLSAVVYSVVQH